jgi:RNA polymerase-binding transcription factor DksA
MTSDQEFAAERTQLITKRDELRARIDKIEADYRNGLDADSEEQAQQLANAEVLEGIAKAASEELQRIEKLLEEMG